MTFEVSGYGRSTLYSSTMAYLCIRCFSIQYIIYIIIHLYIYLSNLSIYVSIHLSIYIYSYLSMYSRYYYRLLVSLWRIQPLNIYMYSYLSRYYYRLLVSLWRIQPLNGLLFKIGLVLYLNLKSQFHEYLFIKLNYKSA